jgi:uncharacterized membrane protein YhaH (DUF805 family)
MPHLHHAFNTLSGPAKRNSPEQEQGSTNITKTVRNQPITIIFKPQIHESYAMIVMQSRVSCLKTGLNWVAIIMTKIPITMKRTEIQDKSIWWYLYTQYATLRSSVHWQAWDINPSVAFFSSISSSFPRTDRTGPSRAESSMNKLLASCEYISAALLCYWNTEAVDVRCTVA